MFWLHYMYYGIDKFLAPYSKIWLFLLYLETAQLNDDAFIFSK